MKPSWITPEIEAEIKVLWEETPQSAADIAARYGISKNVVIGRANRRRWSSFNSYTRKGQRAPETTTAQRLDELHATLDRILAETAATLAANRYRIAENAT